MSRGSGKPLRTLLVIGVLSLVWIVGPVQIRRLLYSGFERFRAPVDDVAASWGSIQEHWALIETDRVTLIEEARKLARENARLRTEIEARAHLETYVENLENLMALPKPPDYHPEYARIVRRDLSAWFETVWLDKGALDGVRPGQGVIFGGGALGRIREVTPFQSLADLVTGPGFRLTVQTAHDDRPITFQGLGQGPGSGLRASVINVPLDLRIEDHQAIPLYTTGLGGPFPRGILIGYLISLEKQTEGLFQKGTVRLDPGIVAAREACILIPGQPNTPTLTRSATP